MRGFGTRFYATTRNNHPYHGSENGSLTRDPGMSKIATASVTFASGQLQAANGTFPTFAINDEIRVAGSNLNNGVFLVTGVDVTNRAFLAVDPAPKAEGPLTVTVRTE